MGGQEVIFPSLGSIKDKLNNVKGKIATKCLFFEDILKLL